MERPGTGAKEPGHGFGCERRAHHDDTKIGSHRLPKANEHAKNEVHFKRSLVKLVEDHGGDSRKRDVVDKPPQHDAGRLDHKPRLPRDSRVKSHLIADFASERDAAELRDPVGDGSCGEPSRLQQDDGSGCRDVIENGGRHKGRLPRSRWRRHDDRPGPRRGDDPLKHIGDRKVWQHRAARFRVFSRLQYARFAQHFSRGPSMGLVKDFRDFAMRGNVIDLAVGVVIGTAFGKIISSLVANIVMPPLNLLTSKFNVNFNDLALRVRTEAPKLAPDGTMVMEGGKPVMVVQDYPVLNYGPFLQSVVDFLLVAIAIFVVIKIISTAKAKFEAEKPVAAAAPPEDIVLLREIRDALKR
jgi:large conductance mechanosensitive channel